MTDFTYRAKDLLDVAHMFDVLAERRDELLTQAASERQRIDIRAAARTWREAAQILRNTKIEQG